MDSNNDKNKSKYDKRIEEWREKRIQKLASRLQRNSDKSRTISTSVLGIGYHRQSITLQPGQKEHEKGSRTNNHRERWNSGYLGHNSMDRQYLQDYLADESGGHGSFPHNQPKRVGFFSSHFSLHDNKNTTAKFNRKYSSCSKINNTDVDKATTDERLLGQDTDNETDNLCLKSNAEPHGSRSQGNADYHITLENVSLVANPEVDDSKLAVKTEPDFHSACKDSDKENSMATVNNDYSPVPVPIIVNGDPETEAYKLVAGEQEDIAREIENIGYELANISIFNKDAFDCGNMTPMKRERKQALLDSTNIIPSSITKYAVREVRKNNEIEIFLTPVRRSIRLSSTPVSKKNLCVQKLEDLSHEVREIAKFVENKSIKILPDC